MATAADGRLQGARSANTSSFSRARSSPSAVLPSPPNPGVKLGPNGATFVSSGIPDLDSTIPSLSLVYVASMSYDSVRVPPNARVLLLQESLGAGSFWDRW